MGRNAWALACWNSNKRWLWGQLYWKDGNYIPLPSYDTWESMGMCKFREEFLNACMTRILFKDQWFNRQSDWIIFFHNRVICGECLQTMPTCISKLLWTSRNCYAHLNIHVYLNTSLVQNTVCKWSPNKE